MFRTKRFILLIILFMAIIVCAVLKRTYHSDPSPITASESTVTAVPVVTSSVAAAEIAVPTSVRTTEPDAEVPYVSPSRYEEIKERMQLLQDSCEDFVGWLYVADSEMDLPVVQGEDNEYYLSHAPDGTYINEGTIFLDCMNSRDLSDMHNVLFGHNMTSGMFGDIRSYKEREEFDRHRYGWFFTPDMTYRIDFFALSVVSTYDVVYDIGSEHSEWLDCIYAKAMYTSDIVPDESDRLIALSTCTSDFANARVVLTGRLVPIENEEDIVEQIQ